MCGITRPQDARAAVTAGADAVGLVFYEASPRCVSMEQGREIRSQIPPFVAVVGVFVNEAPGRIHELAKGVGLDLAQLHGDESEQYCESIPLPYLKVFRVAPGMDVEATAAAYPGARGFLFDTHQEGNYGGTGVPFDWSRIPAMLDRPAIVAGGLDASNVEQVVQRVRPFAVDVSSGIERSPGVKDPTRMKQFVAAVHRGDKSLNS